MKITLGERTAKTAAIYFEQANRPEIRAVLPQKAKTLEEALADFQETQRPGSSSFGRTVWIGRDYVGDIWCYCMDPAGTPNGMVSYCLFKLEFWGKGVMSRALDLFLAELRTRFPWLNTVGAFTFASNTPSVRVLEKNGFRLMERFTEDGVESCYFQK